eukprot:4598674-Amphidinium_carterae.2
MCATLGANTLQLLPHCCRVYIRAPCVNPAFEVLGLAPKIDCGRSSICMYCQLLLNRACTSPKVGKIRSRYKLSMLLRKQSE